MIDGCTQLVGLIGWPVEHSLSPAMQNAAFDALGLNYRYLPLPVAPGQVEVALRGLAALGFRGANVTSPHKQAVMPHLDEITDTAQAIGAVNTIVVHDERLIGHNTDSDGFLVGARHCLVPTGQPLVALVLGAGGAARAAVCGLLRSETSEIVILNRTLERAQALVADLGNRRRWSPRLCALPLTPETVVGFARAADLLVNATTVGMWPYIDGSLWPEALPFPPHLTVFDLVYNPLETRLLQQARQSGARVVGGLEMLLGQGALAFEMWTGEEAPVKVMRAACERALGR